MPKKFWEFRNLEDGNRAELLLYGDISDTSWWGDEVTPKQFAKELNDLGAVSEITVRINSGGGDVFAAQTIGNLLEQNPAYVTARIDGLCASAATVVSSHCNKVIAANDSTYMVHPVKMGLRGYMDAETLKQYIAALDTIRENIVTLYAKKTCREKDEVAEWMDATSWWTGPQAKENGFVDELTDNEEDAVVENRNGVLFVNSVSMNLPFAEAPAALQRKVARQTPPKDAGPKFVQDSLVGNPAGQPANTKPAGQPGQVKEAQDMEPKTVDDLRKAYPALVDQIEQAAAEKATKAATEAATNAERARIKGIEDAALPGSEALAEEAKFNKPMSVSDFAVELVKNAKTQGATYLAQVEKDVRESGINSVTSAPASGQSGGDEFMDAIRAVNQRGRNEK